MERGQQGRAAAVVVRAATPVVPGPAGARLGRVQPAPLPAMGRRVGRRGAHRRAQCGGRAARGPADSSGGRRRRSGAPVGRSAVGPFPAGGGRVGERRSGGRGRAFGAAGRERAVRSGGRPADQGGADPIGRAAAPVGASDPSRGLRRVVVEDSAARTVGTVRGVPYGIAGPVAAAGGAVRRLRRLAAAVAGRRGRRRPTVLLANPARRRPDTGAAHRPAPPAGAVHEGIDGPVHRSGRHGRGAARPVAVQRDDDVHDVAGRAERAVGALRGIAGRGRGHAGCQPEPGRDGGPDRVLREHVGDADGSVR